MDNLTGNEIKNLMRANRITIRQAAAIFDITIKRVRDIRVAGVQGDLAAWEWHTWLVARSERVA